MLLTVHFTTRSQRHDLIRGVVEQIDRPQTITGLPYSTAMSYARFDNFRAEPYQIEEGRRSKSRKRDVFDKRARPASQPSKPKTSIQQAAASGNLGAALNV